MLRKPEWLKIKLPPVGASARTTGKVVQHGLHTVCQEALCPNRAECFSAGTASFLILGNLCTRGCAFCNISLDTPLPPDDQEPKRLAEAVKAMRLKYVVITSVTRDDLEDGGAEHFSRCVTEIKRVSPETAVELLTPDFKACQEKAVSVLAELPLAVFNHNIETVPRLYSEVRKGADFRRSLSLLKQFSVARPDVPTKSGLMLGVGETDDEVMEVLHHLREQGCVMLTIGQYLAPSRLHWPVSRYVSPDAFAEWKTKALEMGFAQVTSGPLVRSSYHAAESHEAVDTL